MFAPAPDGGFSLVGMRGNVEPAAVFPAGVRWSSAHALADCRSSAEAQGYARPPSLDRARRRRDHGSRRRGGPLRGRPRPRSRDAPRAPRAARAEGRVKVLTSEGARALDARTIAAGTPGLVLMKRAATALVREIAGVVARRASRARADRRPRGPGQQRRRRLRGGAPPPRGPRRRRTSRRFSSERPSI